MRGFTPTPVGICGEHRHRPEVGERRRPLAIRYYGTNHLPFTSGSRILAYLGTGRGIRKQLLEYQWGRTPRRRFDHQRRASFPLRETPGGGIQYMGTFDDNIMEERSNRAVLG